METQGTNIFIVESNKAMAYNLEMYLKNRFGDGINVTIFSDGESCLPKIDKQTHIVILAYYLDGKNGVDILKSIKEINEKTEVIMLSSNEDVSVAVETFRMGAKDYVIKGEGALKKVTKLVHFIITEPIRIIAKEFGVSKYMAIFLLTFILMGVGTYFVLKAIK